MMLKSALALINGWNNHRAITPLADVKTVSVRECVQPTLRSDSDTLSLQIPCTRLSTVGSRAFSVFGHSTWNKFGTEHWVSFRYLDQFLFKLNIFFHVA